MNTHSWLLPSSGESRAPKRPTHHPLEAGRRDLAVRLPVEDCISPGVALSVELRDVADGDRLVGVHPVEDGHDHRAVRRQEEHAAVAALVRAERPVIADRLDGVAVAALMAAVVFPGLRRVGERAVDGADLALDGVVADELAEAHDVDEALLVGLAESLELLGLVLALEEAASDDVGEWIGHRLERRVGDLVGGVLGVLEPARLASVRHATAGHEDRDDESDRTLGELGERHDAAEEHQPTADDVPARRQSFEVDEAKADHDHSEADEHAAKADLKGLLGAEV